MYGLGLLAALAAMAAAPAERGAPAEPRPPTTEAVLAKLDDLYRAKSSVARLEIVVQGPRASRTLRVKAWTRGQDRALLVIEAPPREAGIATLRVDDNLWNYLPKVARTIRVPASMMLGAWMGTDFTNDDLVHESSYEHDFLARVDGRSASPPGWLLKLEARPGVVGLWSRLEVVVDDAYLPLTMRYFDRKGRLARTMVFDEVKAVSGGRVIPTHWTLTPEDVEGQRTELRYLEVAFDVDVPDDTFSLSRLERNR